MTEYTTSTYVSAPTPQTAIVALRDALATIPSNGRTRTLLDDYHVTHAPGMADRAAITVKGGRRFTWHILFGYTIDDEGAAL